MVDFTAGQEHGASKLREHADNKHKAEDNGDGDKNDDMAGPVVSTSTATLPQVGQDDDAEGTLVESSRKRTIDTNSTVLLRRSKRIEANTPIHKRNFARFFTLLPKEIQAKIWAMAMNDPSAARSIYLRYPGGIGFQDIRMSPSPALFSMSTVSRNVIKSVYQPMFARLLDGPGNILGGAYRRQFEADEKERLEEIKYLRVVTQNQYRLSGGSVCSPTTEANAADELLNRKLSRLHLARPQMSFGNQQYVDVDRDVVILEPCSFVCRGTDCAKAHFTPRDRAAVRFLAMRADTSEHEDTCDPLWCDLNTVWPNVEVLYLIVDWTNMPAQSNDPRALIRVRERLCDFYDLARFVWWKLGVTGDGGGRHKTLKDIVFVSMTKRLENRDAYHVRRRLTGTDSDIIVG